MHPPGTPRPFLAAACLAAFALWASAGQPGQLSQAVPTRLPTFRDVARSVGLDFVHVNGASEQRFFPEIVGSGGLFFDFDNDGWLDVFLVDGGSLPTPPLPAARAIACTGTAATAPSRTSQPPRASAIASTGWAPAPATTTTTA